MLINREELLRLELPFIHATRTHRQVKRLTLDHHTQIPARPHQPPARMKRPRYRSKPLGNLHEAIGHAAKMLLNSDFAQAVGDQFSNAQFPYSLIYGIEEQAIVVISRSTFSPCPSL